MSGAATQSFLIELNERHEFLFPDDPEPCECAVAPRQELLPPFRWLLRPDDDRFAHPAEAELARLLTFYGVRWAYEPTTFAVRWGEDGQPREYVTPDFYLPDYDLYIELTTMKQRLVTRKNRKFRKLRECYPNVRVRILYLRDFERLREAFGFSLRRTEGRIGEVRFTETDVKQRVAELAEQLAEALEPKMSLEFSGRPVLLGVGKGSRTFLTAISDHVRGLGVPVDLDQVDLSGTSDRGKHRRVRVKRPPSTLLAGRHIIIVQEIISSGLSAAYLEDWLRRQGAADVEICVLLDREVARVLDIPLEFRGFSAPDVSLGGYGLARWADYKDLPFIAEVHLDDM